MPRSSAPARIARPRPSRSWRRSPCAPRAGDPLRSSPGGLALLALLALVSFTLGCAGRCPEPVVDPASVTATAVPCQPGLPAQAVPGDPLTLVGSNGFVYARVDVAAIRRSPYGDLVESAFDWFLRAEVREPGRTAVREGMARTDVIAFSVEFEHGFTMVAQGRYTEADTENFDLTDRYRRREHTIFTRRRTAVSVVQGRYFVVAEGVGVEAVLDRLDGLEDPAPVGGTMLTAVTAMSAYHSYFSMIGIPAVVFRREFEREEGLAGVFSDLRWAGLSVTPSSQGVDVNGRVHTISEGSANAILAKSLEVQQEVVVELDREVPQLAEAGRAVSMTVTGTDATLTLRADDARSRAVIQAMSDAFERQAQRRASYSSSATATSPTPTATP
ncbi:MAG: hypothetical protein H6726_18330 [Sandaracinaceae bacterium]|nr:hypothetical protein [Sandaracinaceae bacterium]